MSLLISTVSSDLEKCLLRSPQRLSSCSQQHESEACLRNAEESTFPVQKHELLVLGSDVDPQIVPGFKYRIRKNDDSRLLFDGNAMLLEGIGQGYGKRLSFASKDLLCNDNFFWSDSNMAGYAFAIVAVQPGDVFDAVDKDGNVVGKAVLKNVDEAQTIVNSRTQNRCHTKFVDAVFSCRIDMENGQHIPANDCTVRGTAKVTARYGCPAVVEEIVPNTDNNAEAAYVLKRMSQM